MRVKKYVGATMQDTIFKVKADLGPDAIILNTRKFKKGPFGLFGKSQVEILAALEEKDEREIEENNKTLEELNNLKKMIREMNKNWQINNFIRDLPEGLSLLYQYFNLQGINVEISKEFITLLKENETVQKDEVIDLVERKLKDFLGSPEPIEAGDSRQVVAFIGPTGVGKTTTIAKLAARFTLDEGIKVGLVTADTYRIAAVQQLKTYSDILNIPLEVVYNEDDLLKVLTTGTFKDYDLILMDTAGSSWNDKIQMGRLQKLLSKGLINETHLIISMNTKSSDITEIIDQFSLFNPDKIILTKLDETMTFGDILNIKDKYNLPYSYITYGQDVPDDIQVAFPGLLVEYLMGDLNE
ncbi:MAG: flagellar biosynthesis protein FlhF [Halanaerobiales bacterium]|nr:flagellar biosynthesis protein FlhF [Halanaerobiales bacterium]